MALTLLSASLCPQAGGETWPRNFRPTAQHEFVPPDVQVELLWAEGEFTEGGAVGPDGSLYFSDIGNRILRLEPATDRVSVFREPSGRANGMLIDPLGNLIVCEGANTGGRRRVSVTSPDGKRTTLADRWRGKRFNSPNDLCRDSQGRVYFTDPRYVGDEPREIDFEGVFLIEPDGTVRLASRDVTKPNGIGLSPDETTLYVVDNHGGGTGPRQLLAFTLRPDGTAGERRVLFDSGDSRGMDGLTIDQDGNIYATAGSGDEAGIYIFGPAGEQLAFLALPGDPANCTFGHGTNRRTLYILAQAPASHTVAGRRPHGLYRVRLAE